MVNAPMLPARTASPSQVHSQRRGVHAVSGSAIDRFYQGVLGQVKECRTVIDLGANIGLAALYFASHYPRCQLFAVEPHPGTPNTAGTSRDEARADRARG